MKIKDTERLLASHAQLCEAAKAIEEAASQHPDELLLDENSPYRDALRDALAAAKAVRAEIGRPLP